MAGIVSLVLASNVVFENKVYRCKILGTESCYRGGRCINEDLM